MTTGYGLDPFGSSEFAGLPMAGPTPELVRSIFTDKGPIAKPPLILKAGTTANLEGIDRLTVTGVTGANFTDAIVGKYVRITGTLRNDGSYPILARISPNSLQLLARWETPDNPTTSWQVYDARTGQIADDPSHVRVRVNGSAVQPEAVYGLLGQIVLPATPEHTDVVEVDYDWVPNPTVDVTRLNSREFKFNGWNNDTGRPTGGSDHTYRYNNVLLEPAAYRTQTNIQQGSLLTVTGFNTITLGDATLLPEYVGLTLQLFGPAATEEYRVEGVVSGTQLIVTPTTLSGPYSAWVLVDQTRNPLAPLAAPQNRELHYRAYERAYTPVMNDPQLLSFNTPIHRVAYPPLSRTLESTFVSYTPTVLPESDPYAAWERVGSGSITLTNSRLVVGANSAGTFPDGSPIFWRRPLDLTFPNTFALAWAMTGGPVTSYDGVWSGLGVGYSSDKRVLLLGLLEVGGVRKVGFLRKGYAAEDAAAWVGGLDGSGLPLNAPAALDWSIPHSYRLFRSRDGVVRVYLDGEVVELLKVSEEELPFLDDLEAPFTQLQQVFWGSISRAVLNTATWDFVRYQVVPVNPLQTTPAIFVSYEGSVLPETALQPWTPVGYHGRASLAPSDYLFLESTSATSLATEDAVGLVGGDFKGYVRTEPLLAVSSDVVLDVALQGTHQTHGASPNAVMAAIDDGNLLTQLSFLTDAEAPKLGYGGRSLPTQWSPTPWASIGTASAQMVGRRLLITDTLATQGRIYYVDDVAPPGSAGRVLDVTLDYTVEYRCRVLSHTADAAGFCGVTVDVYDGSSTLGVMFRKVGTVPHLAFHSDGVVWASYPFNWNDGQPHTYRFAKVGGDVTLFADQQFVGTLPYTTFSIPLPSTSTGVLSFGSATSSSNLAASTTEWDYVNSWRLLSDRKYYVGLWRGTTTNSLIDFHLPTKARYQSLAVSGNVILIDTSAYPPIPSGAYVGDALLIDDGPNQGVYRIVSTTSNAIHLDRNLVLHPTRESFRIPEPFDWRTFHWYRVARTPGGDVVVTVDADTTPLISVEYDSAYLPLSSQGLPRKLLNGLPTICWGAFDPTQLSGTTWDFVRYGITRSPTELRIVPHHERLNQRNVIASPEHLRTSIPHTHTDYWSSSTGIPPQTGADLLKDPALIAYTQLNEGTPLYPLTQTSEVRRPTPYRHYVSAFNRIEDVMNADGDFKFNDGSTVWRLLVPEDVLYNSLEVIEQTTGQPNLLTPFDDDWNPRHLSFEWQKEVCLAYDGQTLPEEAPNQPTPWVMASDDPTHVQTLVVSGLVYGTDGVGTRTIYRNNTPLPDAPGLRTKVRFRMRVNQDGSFGLGDSQIRLGFSAIGMTLALVFTTRPSGDRYVLVTDLNSHTVLGGIPFDFLDGAAHTYLIVRNPGHNTLTVSVES